MNNIKNTNYWLQFVISGIVACLSALAFAKLNDPAWLIASGIFLLFFQQAYIKLGEEE